ncbi:MAG: KpsF/GutQ family sugar-phosphate isomerase [Comamonas sp.]
MTLDTQRVLALAQDALEIEAAAVSGLRGRLGASFIAAVELVLDCRGRIVVMGMGKAGHVGRKIAATLASTGTPAFFVHPGEAAHGDLGMVQPDDVLLAISNSGESDELLVLLPVLKRQGVKVIAMTGGARSSLATHADIVLDSSVDREACPLNLAPTASTTAQMALGDALAVVLLGLRGFAKEDFARSHPGGALGRRLLTHVSDVMRKGREVPSVAPSTPLIELMREISLKGLGAAAIVDAQGRVLGIFTDGDLRRLVAQGSDLRALTAREVMKTQPRTIRADVLAAEAAALMDTHRISDVLVVDEDNTLVGMVTSKDLMQAKVI